MAVFAIADRLVDIQLVNGDAAVSCRLAPSLPYDKGGDKKPMIRVTAKRMHVQHEVKSFER